MHCNAHPLAGRLAGACRGGRGRGGCGGVKPFMSDITNRRSQGGGSSRGGVAKQLTLTAGLATDRRPRRQAKRKNDDDFGG